MNLVDLVKSFQTSIYYLLAKFSFDTAENESLKICQKLAKSQKKSQKKTQETQPRWKFAPERWKDADESLLTRQNSGLTGIDADTFGVPSASPRPAFDGAAYASKLPGTTMVLAPVLSWI